MTVLDARLNAYRSDLADVRLRDRVEAERFVEGERATVQVHFADMFAEPQSGAGLAAQVLYGHSVTVFEWGDEFDWVQTVDDGYVGYIVKGSLAKQATVPTHIVRAPRTFLYVDADLKHPRTGYRSMGSKLAIVDAVTNRGTDYLILSSGEAVIAHHLVELGNWQSDPVSVAETLLHTPYLWGGNTGFGIDCSGLVQLSHLLCGNMILRDSDMQAATFGEKLETDFTDLQRGDLVFWKGHVGMMADCENLLHANGHTMNVALEKLSDAIERIGYLYGQPTMARRFQSTSGLV